MSKTCSHSLLKQTLAGEVQGMVGIYRTSSHSEERVFKTPMTTKKVCAPQHIKILKPNFCSCKSIVAYLRQKLASSRRPFLTWPLTITVWAALYNIKPILQYCGLMESFWCTRASLVDQTVKKLFAMQENRVRPLGWEDPWQKEMVTHSSILVTRSPWTEEPGRLQSTGLQRVGHGWATLFFFFF